MRHGTLALVLGCVLGVLIPAAGIQAAPNAAKKRTAEPAVRRPAQQPARKTASRPAVQALRAPNNPAGKRVAKPRGRWAPVTLFHVNRRETLSLRLADDRGRPVRGVDKRVSRFLRCHHTNTQHRMDPRLVRLIYETGRHYPGKRIDVISGYRHPKVAKNPKSPHMKGLACDFRIEGVSNTELRDFLRRNFKNIGVGYYPNSSFVHLDVRKGPSAFWIDYSRPKEDAIYSDNPFEDLRTGKAESWKPTRIDPSWADEGTPEDEGHKAAPAGVTPGAPPPDEPAPPPP